MSPHALFISFLALWSIHTFAQKSQPNILLIVADDLGYASIEPFGGEISTPFLNDIAQQSLLLTNFHALPTCSPSRAVLLTGTDNHIVGIGAQKGGISDKQKGQPGYEGYLNFRAATLPERLQANGFRTYMSGKWHLGTQDEHAPYQRGFQETFTLVSSGGSHYADQLPLRPAEPMLYRRNGAPLRELPADFYSSKNYTDSLLLWLERDKASGQPFFAYLAYTAPHDPLQAPEAYIEKYRGTYDEGYEAIRAQKFTQLQQSGIIDPAVSLPDWPSFIPRWNSLSVDKQQKTLRDMETYAAMVEYMDHQIGRVYEWLATNQELDNTMIIFISDNGISGLNPKKVYPSYTEEFDSQFDNSLANRGLPNSFTVLDAGWAVASTVVYRDFKYSTAEGGIRTPCIIKPASPTHSSPIICRSFTHIRDLMPTVLALTDSMPSDSSSTALAQLKGKSLLPLFSDPNLNIHVHTGHGFELHGNRAYIKDGWKIFQSPMPTGSGDWELYHVAKDPGEQQNLIFTHRDQFNVLYEDYLGYEAEVGVIYDLPLSFSKVEMAYQVIFWSLIATLCLSLIGYWKTLVPNRFSRIWGYTISFIDLIAIAALFTPYHLFAAYVLLATKGMYMLTLIVSRVKGVAYIWAASSTILLGMFLVLKSGWLVTFLL